MVLQWQVFNQRLKLFHESSHIFIPFHESSQFFSCRTHSCSTLFILLQHTCCWMFFPPDVTCTQPYNCFPTGYFHTFQVYLTRSLRTAGVWYLVTVCDQNNMANSAKRAPANITVSDSLSYSSASPVLSVSSTLLCVNNSKSSCFFLTALIRLSYILAVQPETKNR